MNKKILSIVVFALVVGFGSFFLFNNNEEVKNDKKIDQEKELTASVIAIENDLVTVLDNKDAIYMFNLKDFKANVGDNIVISYTGILDKDKVLQDNIVVINDYKTAQIDDSLLPVEWLEEGLFKNFYNQAFKKLKTLSLDEKIGELLLVRYQEASTLNDLKTYHFGGIVFFEKDFTNKTSDEVKKMINDLQKNTKIPLLTAVDEEGGKVTRISKNSNLVSEPFKSSQDLYNDGGFENITKDTKEKSKILANLGLNLNLAPVVDVSTNPSDYMYPRSFGKNTSLTSNYAKTVIEASKGTGVSYTLKHFPGYGNNADTHNTSSVDNRTLESIFENDLPPFEAGINAQAEAVLVSHNIVKNIDDVNPASLSPAVHNILRNRLNFSGIIITDDLAMGATSNIDNASVKAILAGNDLIITTDYKESVASIKNALNNGTISEELINRVSLRVLAWKYYKGLIFDNEK